MTELLFVGGRPIGELLEDGVFEQKVTGRHVFRQFNSKGIDLSLYRSLVARCRTWRLEFKDTKQILEIPFEKIASVGFQLDTGAGRQIMVKLEDFEEKQAVMQGRMI